MNIKKRLISREILGDRFLIPVGKTVYDSNGLYVLTELGEFVWALLPEAKDAEDIIAAVVNNYDVDEATARTDVNSFLGKLTAMGII
jgi:hypothetical protein